MNYGAFLERKKQIWSGAGVTPPPLSSKLYDWQAAITRWALRKGRACIFADCGLGKTFMQVAWAHALNEPTLILSPLCVAEQTIAEAAKLGIAVEYSADGSRRGAITITNYERLDKFTLSEYRAVVLDESSILKAFDGKTRTRLIQAFAETPYRLCCTATPSPNDIAELANHAEFLGLMTRPEFLATWFVHDDSGWRMKRHAVTSFYRWLASWAIALRLPSDLGYHDNGFRLPKLHIRDRCVVTDAPTGESLFPELSAKGIRGRLSARRDSLDARVDETARLISHAYGGCQWLVWCGLNDEARDVTAALPGAVNVQGSDSHEVKAQAVRQFLNGDIRVLVSKVRILGYGMNFQNCHHMVFLGIGDSFEQYYQAIRRCWRFGQTVPVSVDIVVSESERLIVENVQRKEREHHTLTSGMLAHMVDFERAEVGDDAA